MSVGLFMDLLGVRSMWKSGGRIAAETAFDQFRISVSHGIGKVDASSIEKGVLESDSAFLICDSLHTALQIGQGTYLHAFRFPAHERRMWIRGVIMPGPDGTELVTSSYLKKSLPQVEVIKYKSQVLDAIAAEKSGFKGMRLLVGGGKGVGHAARKKLTPICIGELRLRPFLKIKTPLYPEALAGYHDFLWMATENDKENDTMSTHMFHRLRWAASNPEELVHAAITQVIFNHWASLRRSGSSYLPKA
ncbi:hypothetical protein KA005_37160 [bacterium]|nr:hypothetical protein [bacterium]